MASFAAQCEYDVHICYNGTETKNTLIGHLNHALFEKQISTTSLDFHTRGEEISQATIRAIEASRISILVFCHNFASSSRCLDEVVTILDCQRKGQLVRPLFFQTDQLEVRDVEGSYKKAMAGHREKFKNERMKVERWEVALHDAANLPGWAYTKGCQAEFIHKIVEEIRGELNCIGIGGKRNGVQHSFSNAARLQHFFTCSSWKESENGKRFMTGEPSTSTGLVPNTGLLSVSRSEGNGMKKRKCISNGALLNEGLAQAEMKKIQHSGSQVSIPRGIEDGLISRELKGNVFDLLKDASVEALLAFLVAKETTLSTVQDAASVTTRTTEEVKSSLLSLQTNFSRNFCDLIPEGSKFMEFMENDVLSFRAEEKISQPMAEVLKKLQLCFTHWRKDYEDAGTMLETTSADLLKDHELQKEFTDVLSESKKAVSAENEAHIQLFHLLCKRREIEEERKVVDAKIAHLRSYCQTVAAEKISLQDKGTKLKIEKDKLMVLLPRIMGDREAARVTQETIEAGWSNLVEVFNIVLAREIIF